MPCRSLNLPLPTPSSGRVFFEKAPILALTNEPKRALMILEKAELVASQ